MINPKRNFIDTNILVYAYDTSAKRKQVIAQSILSNVWENGTGYISIQVLQEFFVACTQKVKTPIPINIAKDIIYDLSLWRTYCPVPADVFEAITIKEKYKISFWDAMIIICAKRLNCTKIYTEDLNHNQLYEDILIDNPFIS